MHSSGISTVGMALTDHQTTVILTGPLVDSNRKLIHPVVVVAAAVVELSDKASVTLRFSVISDRDGERRTNVPCKMSLCTSELRDGWFA